MTERLTQLMRMHEQEPEDTFCTYGIAMEHNKAGRQDEALAWLNRTLGIDPKYAYAWYQKARVLADMGRNEDAREAATLGIDAARKQGDAKAVGELEELLEAMR
ncbi:MAG: tetratricopeptide repeat protein [Phycisphaeraceae bacterium]|nr:tetratricopeptide repeat protein [Phycisphaeraceae bacterium]